MEANELMIGDWVKLDFYDNAYVDKEDAVWKNGKITAIHHGNWVDINFGGHLDECDIEVEDIQPIPITPEILEKNGFRHGDGFEKRWYDMKVEDKKVSLYQSNTFYTLKIDEGIWPKLNNINIHFVHELQHALRLCGIEKEIVL